MTTPAPNQPSRVVKGRVISGQELKEYAERHGLCTICGQYQTHERSGNWLRSRFEPMTVRNSKGVITVYKGYCIQPTCYPSVEFVQELLGEIPRKERRPGPRTSGGGASITTQPRPRVGGVGGVVPSAPQPPDVSPRQQGSGRERARLQETTTTTTTTTAHYPHRPSGGDQTNRSSQQYPPNRRNTSEGSNSHSAQPHPSPQGAYSHVRSSTDSSRYHNRQADEISFVPPPEPGRYSQGPRNGTAHDGNGSSSAFDASSEFQSNSHYEAPRHNSGAPLRSSDHQSAHNRYINEEEEKHMEETDPELEALEAQLVDGDYIGFLNRLDNPSIQHYVAIDGLDRFRRWVIRDQLEKPDGVVLGFDGWVKTIKTLVEQRFPGDRDMTLAGLVTFLSLSTLPGNYKKYMIKKRGIDLLLKVFDDFEDDSEVANLSGAAITSLCSSEKDGLSAKFESSANVIRKLVQVVATENGKGRGYALMALSHLANQRRRAAATNKTLANDIRSRLAETENSVKEICRIVRDDDVHPKVVEAGMCLLWRLSFPKEDDETALPVTPELVEIALFVIENSKVAGAIQAGCGTVANVSLDKRFPVDSALKLMRAICAVLNEEAAEEGLAVCGLHAFCNLLAVSQAKRQIAQSMNLLPTTYAMMRNFPACEEVVEFGCLIVAQIARDDLDMKEKAIREGGFVLVQRALEHFVTLRSDRPSLVVKDASLCALAAISGCGAGTQELIRSGLLDTLHAMFAVETDDDFRCILQAILQNAQNAQSNGGFSSSSRRGVLSSDPQAFARMVGSASSEDAVFALVDELQDIGPLCLQALADRGFDTLLAIMSNFRNAPLIQEKGCAVLARVYFHLPFSAMNSMAEVPGGSLAAVHKAEVFETIHRAMNMHRRDPSVQHYACAAVYNFLAAMHGNENALREVSQWTRPFLGEACEAISNNPGDKLVLKSGLSLFGLLTSIHGAEDARQWRLPTLQHVFDALNQFAEDPEVTEICFGILLQCEDDIDSMEFIGNSGGVGIFMTKLLSQDAGVVLNSSKMLASLLQKVFSASSQISQIPRAHHTLIDCMEAYRDKPEIQLNITSAFEALLNFGDFSMVGSGTESRMIRVLCGALRLDQDKKLVEKACRVLSLIIPSMEPEKVDAERNVLGPALGRVMEGNLENPEIEAAVMDALSSCCDQVDYFKYSLLNESSVRMLIQAMSLNLGSVELQRSGCSLLWILSGYGHGRQMIGGCGGVAAVVNAMLAHNQSTVVQKEGLTVLKNLATASSNKDAISSTGGEDAVQYALWIHYREPQVISVALSALNNIAVDSERKTVAEMRENILDVVIAAMKRFPRDETVQKNSCFYLKSCSYSRTNLAMMHQKRGELSQVLRHAGSAFPGMCRDRAMSVLAKVEQFR